MTITTVLVPGIMGTELTRTSGEVVWPPKVRETIFGYNRIDALQDPTASPTRIIANVSCVDFYAPLQSLLAELGFGATGDRRLVEHPYDWRRDLFELANGLAARLDDVDSEEVVIVAHSMGGLIARLVLETPAWRDRPWFQKITGFIALATPHNGAPLALARVLGLDNALGISPADWVTLSQNPAFPSGYQLLPAPGEDACWDEGATAGLVPLDFYNPAVAEGLGMKPALVARTKALHDALHAGEQPAHVRYFFFAGAGHKTVTRVNVAPGGARKVETAEAGDGTVPIWSALPRAVQKQVIVNEHANIFRGGPFKRVFFRLLGGDAGPPTEAPRGADFQLSVSLQKPVFPEAEPVDLILSAEMPFGTLQGRLVFEARGEGDEAGQIAAAVPVAYSGPPIPWLAMTVPARLVPGIYEVRFEGDRQQVERAVFTVSR